jgi:hypothetical protein
MVVPLSAVVTRADGTAVVLVETAADAPLKAVRVQAGVTGEGLVEVNPIKAGELKLGDLVLVADRPDDAPASPSSTQTVGVVSPVEGSFKEISTDEASPDAPRR